MPTSLPLILAAAAAALVALAVLLWFTTRRKPRPRPLPAVWALNPRPVFSNDERRLYRQLREAFPQHVVLAKLPIVRFCQPVDPREVRKWFELLANIHVSFAVCSASGRVLAAVDLDSKRGNSRRSQEILQNVLAAIKVRYLRCEAGTLPSLPELHSLLPEGGAGEAVSAGIHQVRDTLASTVASKRRERTNLWQESSFAPESFFSPDSRNGDLGPPSRSPALAPAGAARTARAGTLRELPVLTDEGGGMVVDVMPTMRH